jgi:hypothetical protein
MLTRDYAPWLLSLALLVASGLEVEMLISSGRWAATAIWIAAIVGGMGTWWMERRKPDARIGLDRMLGAFTLVVVAAIAFQGD